MPGWLRFILAVVFPPLAVADLGVKPLVITSILFTIFFPFGGVLAAVFFLVRDQSWRHPPLDPPNKQGGWVSGDNDERYERAVIELADGEVLEIVDTEAEERRNQTQRR